MHMDFINCNATLTVVLQWVVDACTSELHQVSEPIVLDPDMDRAVLQSDYERMAVRRAPGWPFVHL